MIEISVYSSVYSGSVPEKYLCDSMKALINKDRDGAITVCNCGWALMLSIGDKPSINMATVGEIKKACTALEYLGSKRV